MNVNIDTTKGVVKKIDEMGINKIIYQILKRTIDIIGAFLGCIILIPLTLGIGIANIIAKDNGPLFYVQKRIGKNGKSFKMYKYRSMIVDADGKLKKYLMENPEANEEYMKFRKLKADPRVTLVGKFIRKTNLDEFPQFINILKGEMSLVGPRPYMTREKRAMKKAYKEIIKVKPGLTGPWQINGRSEISLEERLNIDIEYINNQNFINDIKYLFKTVFKIFRTDNGAV